MRRVLAAVLVAGSFISSLPASAHDHRPPKIKLWVEASGQRGSLGTHSWSTPSGPNECVGWVSDGISSFPDPILVNRGEHTADLVLRTRHRPRKLLIRTWTEVDEREEPQGSAQEPSFRLSREHRGKRVVFIASIRLPVQDHLYIDVYGVWRDAEGCGASQDASWTFHLAVA